MNANEISPKGNARMNRIKRVIKIIKFLLGSAVILGFVFGLFFLADLLGYPAFGSGVKMSFSPLLTYTSPFNIPAIVLVLGFVRAGLFFAGALVLFWLLNLYEAGKFFTAQNVHHIKLLGCL
ncbi:MAG: hypothetical protein WDN00_01600 [Limisphaerales bacterium]